MSKTIRVNVKPNSRTRSLDQSDAGFWVAKLKSPPVHGKANEELIALVVERFECGKSRVSIKSGTAGRIKLVEIEGI